MSHALIMVQGYSRCGGVGGRFFACPVTSTIVALSDKTVRTTEIREKGAHGAEFRKKTPPPMAEFLEKTAPTTEFGEHGAHGAEFGQKAPPTVEFGKKKGANGINRRKQRSRAESGENGTHGEIRRKRR